MSIRYFSTYTYAYFYKNKGYYNVIIESSFANYLGNDQFEIIYNISSGKKFYFNEFNLNLPLDYDRANFQQLDNIFKKLKGESYSLNSIDNILKEKKPKNLYMKFYL